MAYSRPTHQTSSIRGITPLQLEASRAAIQQLSEALAPHLKTRFDERAREFGQSEAVAEHLRRIPGAGDDPAHMAEFHEQEFRRACFTIVTQWLSTLHDSAALSVGSTGVGTLDAATLDDAMLPPNFAAERELWTSAMSSTMVTLDDAIVALRAFRAALPDGKRLPDEVAVFLSPRRITVQNA